MAQPIICSLDGVERAAWIIGDMESGDQYPLCAACIIGWMLAKLDAELTPEGKAHVVSMWTPPAGDQVPEEPPAGDASKSGPGRPGRRKRALVGLGEAVADANAEEAATAAQAPPEADQDGGEPAAADAS